MRRPRIPRLQPRPYGNCNADIDGNLDGDVDLDGDCNLDADCHGDLYANCNPDDYYDTDQHADTFGWTAGG